MTAASLPLICGVESFSGRGELPRAMCDFVGPFFTFELEGDPNQVFLTKEGMLLLVQMCLRIQIGGLLWLGTPCKSWVVLSR